MSSLSIPTYPTVLPTIGDPSTSDPDLAFRHISEAQHGVALRSQARGVGLSTSQIRRRIEKRIYEELSPTVLRLVGVPFTDLSLGMAAVLDAGLGGCICLDSATAMYGAPGFRLRPLHVWRVRDRSSSANALAIQHKSRVLPAHHVLSMHGIPITSPTRTVLDQAARLHPMRVARLMDTFWSERLTDWKRLDAMTAQLSQRGREGPALVRTLLDDRGPDYRPPASNLERRFHTLVNDAGLGPYRAQVDVGDDDEWIGRIDLEHARKPLLIEIDSDRYHTAFLDRQADERRDTRLGAAGFEILRVPEFDIWYRKDEMLARVAAKEHQVPNRG